MKMIVNCTDNWLFPHLSSKKLPSRSTCVSLLFLVVCLPLRKEWGRGDPFFFCKSRKRSCPQGHRKEPLWVSLRWLRLASNQRDKSGCLPLNVITTVAAWGFVEQQPRGMRNSLCGLLVCTGQMVCFLHFGVVYYVVCDRLRLFGLFYMGKLRLRLSDLPKLPQQIGSGLRFLDSLFTLLSKCYRYPLVSSQPASHFWE